MSGKVVFSATALLATLVSAANVNVHNQCNFDVQLTPSQSGTDQGPQDLKAGDTFTRPVAGDAWCLKMYGPGATKPTQLEWSVSSGTLFYDLSDIDMGADTTFLHYGMSLTSDDTSCKDSHCSPIVCKPGGNTCDAAYNAPDDLRTLAASPNYDLNMILCDGSQGTQNGGNNGSTQSNQPPQNKNKAGTPVQLDNNGNAYEGDSGSVVNIVQTQVVTQVVTARDAEATEPIMRRHVHHPHGRHH